MTHSEIDGHFELLTGAAIDRAVLLGADDATLDRMRAISDAGRALAKSLIFEPLLASSYPTEYRQVLDLVGRGCSVALFLGQAHAYEPTPYELAAWHDDGGAIQESP